VTSLSEQLLAEAGLPAELSLDLEPVLNVIRDFLPERVPAPSPALAALLARPPRPMAPRSRGRLAVLGSAAALMSSLTVTGVAAAANELPVTTQKFVADLSEKFLPFQFPQPSETAITVEEDQEAARVSPSEAVSADVIPPTLQETAIREETTPEGEPQPPSQGAVVPNTAPAEPSPDAPSPAETATAAATATASATAETTAEATATATATVEATTGTSTDPRVGDDPSAPTSSSPTASPTTDTTSVAPSPSQSPSQGPSGPTR
jgi:hypothetical protein